MKTMIKIKNVVLSKVQFICLLLLCLGCNENDHKPLEQEKSQERSYYSNSDNPADSVGADHNSSLKDAYLYMDKNLSDNPDLEEATFTGVEGLSKSLKGLQYIDEDDLESFSDDLMDNDGFEYGVTFTELHNEGFFDEDDFSSKQLELLLDIDEALKDQDDFSKLEKDLEKIVSETKDKLDGNEKAIVLQSESTARHSFKYWDKNLSNWCDLNPDQSDCNFSDDDVSSIAKYDYKGFVVGAVATGTPKGAVLGGATGSLGGAIGWAWDEWNVDDHLWDAWEWVSGG